MELDHELRIERVRRRAALRDGGEMEPVDPVTPLDEMMAAEELELRPEGDAAEELAAVRAETFRRLLGWVFEDGAHPGRVVRRIYALAHQFAPEELEGMNQTDLATMLGESRQAFSRRMGLLFGEVACNGRKLHSTRRKYAAAARGNHARRSGEVMRRARERCNREHQGENGQEA